jgi:hypothetical protein
MLFGKVVLMIVAAQKQKQKAATQEGEAACKETKTFHCRRTENLVDVNHAIP